MPKPKILKLGFPTSVYLIAKRMAERGDGYAVTPMLAACDEQKIIPRGQLNLIAEMLKLPERWPED